MTTQLVVLINFPKIVSVGTVEEHDEPMQAQTRVTLGVAILLFGVSRELLLSGDECADELI